MGGGGNYRPAPAEAPPKEEDPQVQKRKAARATQQRYAQGFSSTIATDRAAMGGTQTPTPGTVEKLG
jgi:hypothetical protein